VTATRTERVDAGGGDWFDATVVGADRGGPGILLLQEIFGVGEFVLAKAHALAEEGYVVLCPDVFWRVERNIVLGHDEAGLQQAFGFMGRYTEEVPDDTKDGDLLAALDHLRSLPDVDGRRVAAMGYCLGGNLAYRVAVAGDPDACVSYYGSGIAGMLDRAHAIRCPVLFHFGGDDAYIPREEVDRVDAAFADRDDVEVHVHAGAGHAFENFAAPMYHAADATAAAWPITLDFFRRTLQP
jgi:carboxymethylenebutenolidase